MKVYINPARLHDYDKRNFKSNDLAIFEYKNGLTIVFYSIDYGQTYNDITLNESIHDSFIVYPWNNKIAFDLFHTEKTYLYLVNKIHNCRNRLIKQLGGSRD